MTKKQSIFALLGAFFLGAVLAVGGYRATLEFEQRVLVGQLLRSQKTVKGGPSYPACIETIVRVGNLNSAMRRGKR